MLYIYIRKLTPAMQHVYLRRFLAIYDSVPPVEIIILLAIELLLSIPYVKRYCNILPFGLAGGCHSNVASLIVLD